MNVLASLTDQSFHPPRSSLSSPSSLSFPPAGTGYYYFFFFESVSGLAATSLSSLVSSSEEAAESLSLSLSLSFFSSDLPSSLLGDDFLGDYLDSFLALPSKPPLISTYCLGYYGSYFFTGCCLVGPASGLFILRT